MLTIDTLKAFGADTAEGLTRCLNKEDFYLRLVGTVPNEPNFDRLAEAIAAKDLDAGFEAAHALKGISSNLSLTPLTTPVSEMTELLRGRTDTDYSALLAEVLRQRELLRSLCED